nr:hypothetical protein [Tanacetum cinerariifolium]
MPPKPDLVYPSLDDFIDVNKSVSESEVEKPTIESNESKIIRKENGAPIIEDWVYEIYPSLDDFVDESVSESVVKKPIVDSNEPKTIRKENRATNIEDWVSESEDEDEPKSQSVKLNFTKIEFVKPKTNRKAIEQIRKDTYRINAARQKFSKATVTVNTARPVNTAHPKITMNAAKPRSCFSNSAHLIVKRPINNRTTSKNRKINQKVNTVRATHVNTARPKVNTARLKAVLNAVQGNQGNPQQDLKDKGVIEVDALGT